MAIAEDKKAQIIALLREGTLRNEEIGARLGVSPGTVSAMRSHLTMGRYTDYPSSAASDAQTDELIEAAEITFGLERDLQMALRSNIEQLEPGLEIIDGGKERITEAGRIDITARDSKETT